MPSAQTDLNYMLRNLRDAFQKIDEAGEEIFGKREWDRAIEDGRRAGRLGNNPAEDPMPYGVVMMADVEDAAVTVYLAATEPKFYAELMELSTGELVDALKSGSFLNSERLPDKMTPKAWARARTRLLKRK